MSQNKKPKGHTIDRTIHRSAVTGQFVSAKYARQRPSTTVTEKRKIAPDIPITKPNARPSKKKK